MRQWKRWLLCSPLVVLASGCTPMEGTSLDGATVSRVVDGDTIETETGERVRVLGIDTPEVYGGKECWGPEASQWAEGLLEGEVVTLKGDPSQDEVDRYDRLLRYIILPDGRNYSVVAAELGHAEAYVYNDNPVAEHSAIAAAEQRALENDLGMWGRCK